MASSLSAASIHPSSDVLADRHPYRPELHAAEFAKEVNPHEVRRAFGRRGLEKLVSVLNFADATNKEVCEALVLLHNDLSTQEKKLEAIAVGAVKVCTQKLSAPHVRTRGNAALVLGQIGLLLQGRAELKKEGSLVPLTSLCKDGDADVRDCAAKAISSVCMFRDGFDVIMATPDAVKNLVECLDIQPKVMTAFSTLTPLYKEGCEAALEFGIMPRLATMLKNGKDADLLAASLKTMRALVTLDAGKERAIAVGAVPILVGHLSHETASVQVQACGVLTMLCVALPAKKAFLECGSDGVVALARLIDGAASPAIVTNATLASRIIADLPAGMDSIVREMVKYPEMVRKVFGREPKLTRPLCDLLTSDDTETRESALSELSAFADTPEGCLALIETLHMVPRLAAALGHKDTTAKAKRVAAQTLRALCVRFPDAAGRMRKELEGPNAPGIRTAMVAFPALANVVHK